MRLERRASICTFFVGAVIAAASFVSALAVQPDKVAAPLCALALLGAVVALTALVYLAASSYRRTSDLTVAGAFAWSAAAVLLGAALSPLVFMLDGLARSGIVSGDWLNRNAPWLWIGIPLGSIVPLAGPGLLNCVLVVLFVVFSRGSRGGARAQLIVLGACAIAATIEALLAHYGAYEGGANWRWWLPMFVSNTIAWSAVVLIWGRVHGRRELTDRP